MHIKVHPLINKDFCNPSTKNSALIIVITVRITPWLVEHAAHKWKKFNNNLTTARERER